ncbi:DUF2499 domain-containing protein [Leptolyngbya sp. Cla-17]|uniref:DUF2499 domain-containing protein n=1 Tax=Leptolyngbya sp. Cla-17 TaxID=2803751 RepID=UPI0018D85AAE|nr:DUF2499 domain-containing protein [Leptolyngbya sp. Cla-17]
MSEDSPAALSRMTPLLNYPEDSPYRYIRSAFPMNALSIPTWIIHISSVVEWIAAIWLIWSYGEVINNPAWKALSFGMLPALVSAMCACTWHFFDNPSSLAWLVTLQAAMTVLGNVTVMLAAWWIWQSAQTKIDG